MKWTEDTDPTLPEVEGHAWLKPAPEQCPKCPCCTAALCVAGFEHVWGCSSLCAPDDYGTVKDCSCTGEDARGSAAYRSAMARGRRRAREMPLDPDAEDILIDVVRGVEVTGDSAMVKILECFRYVLRDADDKLTITGAGQAYLNERKAIQ